MATKPLSSTLPRYADTVSGDPSKVSEPPSGKKDIGWLVGEKPPAQWKNWLLLQTYNWLVWLDAFETESHTWTKLQTLTASVLNTRAILATGNGSGSAIKGIGGAAGNGIEAEASGAGTYALYGKGTALGVIGVRGEGGSGSVGGSFIGGGVSAGLSATAGSGGGIGITGLGILTGAGGSFQGGATGEGIVGIGGTTSGRGGDFTGGPLSSDGLRSTGGSTNGNGVVGFGTGSGSGITGTGGATGNGAVFAGGGTSGDGLQSTGGPAGYGGLFTGGSNGPGVRALGGAGNAPGLQAVPSGNGAGIEAAGGGTGIAIAATANVTTTTDFVAGSGALCTVSGSKIEFSTVTHPAGTASIKHQVRPINTVRAYLSLVTDGVGGHTVEDSVGIASVALTATTIDITFADAFATAKYVASPTGNGATYTVVPANKTTGTCKVTSSLNPTGNIIALDVIFLGRQ